MATPNTSATDEDQIRTVIADRAAAMRDRDAERFVAHYAQQIVKFDLAPPLLLTAPEARDAEALSAWFASHPGGHIDYEIHDLTVTVGGDVAFCHSLIMLPARSGFAQRSGYARSTANGRSRMSITPPRSTWTARTKPPSTCSLNTERALASNEPGSCPLRAR